ncbi:DUF397 domain-containing protein [Lentzea flava]|uniref:DUF397 domain-containing protein n=1 Tax=Lentzea flava TaxID=103732 RepID=UPI0016705189
MAVPQVATSRGRRLHRRPRISADIRRRRQGSHHAHRHARDEPKIVKRYLDLWSAQEKIALGFKSSYSQPTKSSCVEIRFRADQVGVRDSEVPAMSRGAWLWWGMPG